MNLILTIFQIMSYNLVILDDKLRGHYMGCFEDSLNSRLLNGHLYIFKNNSPSYCVTMCLRAGYSFAG